VEVEAGGAQLPQGGLGGLQHPPSGGVGDELSAAPLEQGRGHRRGKVRLVDATETRRTNVFDLVRGPVWPVGYTARAIVNSTVARWHRRENELLADLDTARHHYRRAVATDDTDVRVVWAGTGVSRIHEVLPAGDIVRSMNIWVTP
jgi:hypothetical protein